ncbi:MAG TPA: gliding motility-associated C-terminal domain-containing protein [Cyclobacteriaceae bacterium]|nr:gliding motility-associated C-terminal domain-containing protein [Cyclobacteriaceae bacterium]
MPSFEAGMMSLGKYVTALFFLFFSTTISAQISSDFATNADGWTAPSAQTFNYVATGGNPGGFISGTAFSINVGATTIYGYYYFNAPGKFLGNRNAYYNGTLRFDLQQSTTGTPTNGYSQVQLVNNAGVGIYYYPPAPFQPPATGTWQTFSVNLGASSGYWKTTNSATGTAATEAEIRAILSDLATLSIRGHYRDANVTTRLDNVTMMPPIIINTQPTPQAICSGASTTFTTSASNNPNITYHWQIEAAPSQWADLSNNSTYSNVTTATLTVATAGSTGAGNYRCRVSGTAADDVYSSAAALTFLPAPPTPSAPGVSSCTSPITLTASGGTNGQYRWYTSGGTLLTGEVNSTYTTPVLSVPTTLYYVALTNGTCQSALQSVTANLVSPPPAPTAANVSSCVSGGVAVTASGGTVGQYRWYTVATGGTPIAGQTSDTYQTQTLTATTTYYVALNNNVCDGPRTAVTVNIGPPAAPTATATSSCTPASSTITATGGANGQYRWYTVATGGTPVAGQVNSTYVTSVLSTTTTFYVAINIGGCESARTAVVVSIAAPSCNNHPPEIETTPSTTVIGGDIELDLEDLITDADNNLDPSTLKVITKPASGAVVTIQGLKLLINYDGISFVGKETVTISVCDAVGACTQQTFEIDVVGDVKIYDAISPGSDGKNDVFFIENIDILEKTRVNHVSIYNRWGDLVWEGNNYNNTSVVFKGKSKNDGDLPSGTYFYKIQFNGEGKPRTGAITLKR